MANPPNRVGGARLALGRAWLAAAVLGACALAACLTLYASPAWFIGSLAVHAAPRVMGRTPGATSRLLNGFLDYALLGRIEPHPQSPDGGSDVLRLYQVLEPLRPLVLNQGDDPHSPRYGSILLTGLGW